MTSCTTQAIQVDVSSYCTTFEKGPFYTRSGLARVDLMQIEGRNDGVIAVGSSILHICIDVIQECSYGWAKK